MVEESNAVKIALLEQRMNDFYNVINKLDSAIEKLSEVNTNIIKMLAVHEEKIGQTERAESSLTKVSNEIKDEAKTDKKDINLKVEKLDEKFTREIDDLKKYKWLSVAYGTVAAIFFAGVFQLLSGWNGKTETTNGLLHPAPAPLTTNR